MKRKFKIIFLILLVISIHTYLFATAQVSDILILNNEDKPLCTNPLKSLFSKNSELKEKFDTIFSQHEGVISTACWRGYIAKFKIIDSSLYLVDITIEILDAKKAKTELFPTKDISVFLELFESDKPLLCDFYSGMLIIPQGEMVEYVHGGYLSEYEKYILIKISDGKVINKGEYLLQNYKEKKDKAFENFYKSDKYEECWNKIKNGFVRSVDEELKKEIMKEKDDFYLYDFYDF